MNKAEVRKLLELNDKFHIGCLSDTEFEEYDLLLSIAFSSVPSDYMYIGEVRYKKALSDIRPFLIPGQIVSTKEVYDKLKDKYSYTSFSPLFQTIMKTYCRRYLAKQIKIGNYLVLQRKK